jgi:hypothetical protein
MEARGIIMSIRPEHAFDIMSGRKTVELRRRFGGEHRGCQAHDSRWAMALVP